MTVEIARSLVELFKDEPLTWRPVKRKDDTDTALVVCVNGHSGLIDEHDIEGKGHVAPSVVCTENGCMWHEYIILLDWENR